MVRMAILLVAGLVLGAFVAGCGGSATDDTSAPAESTATGGGDAQQPADASATPDAEAPEAEADAGSDADGIDPLSGAGTEPVSGEGTGEATALLTRVALGRHEGFDRVVMEFRDHVPGHRIRYIPPPVTEDGSGRPLAVEGDAIVEVRLEPASSYDFEAQAPAFTPRRVDGAGAGTSVVREVVRSGDFEAVLTWVVGLSDRVDFRVSTLQDPPRLVIDFRNH